MTQRRHRVGIRTWLYDQMLSARVRDKNFTIVPNNCWGSEIYRACKITYLTPFIGLFIYPDCYLRLLCDFWRIIHAELTFKDQSRYERVNEFRRSWGLYPIGLLGGEVEVHFQHYPSAEDAREKWRRRTARMVTDETKLFVKFCDGYPLTEEHLRSFDAVPIPHKVCFVSHLMSENKTAVYIPGHETSGHMPDGPTLYHECRRYFDVAGWLNGQGGQPGLWYQTYVRSMGI